MTARRSLRWGALVAAAALALSACTTIPNSGPVNEGTGVVSSSEPFVPLAVGPRVDETPTAIVNGFVRASSAGFASDFTVAREFLTPEAAATWDPNEQVIVFDSGALTPNFDEDTSTVTYDIPVKATVDESGQLVEAADGTRVTLTFEMEQDADDQWRIAGLENGAILANASFQTLFTDVDLVFASVDETTQVPDQRWFPANKAATLGARELLDGPSQLLVGAVHTGFPPGSALEVDSVQVTNGIAAVQLTAASAGTAEERSLAHEQMELTLKSISGISTVTVTVDGVPLGVDGSASLEPAPLPGTDAFAFVNGRLGIWDGADVWQVPDSVGALPVDSTGIAQTFGDARAVWLVDGRRLVASAELAEGADGLDPANAEAEVPDVEMETRTLLEGDQLAAPSADRHGWIWTAELDGGSGMYAVTATGERADLAVDWLRGTTVQAVSVARDGARVAVLSQAGGKQVLEVAAIVRGEDGTPLTVGEPQTFGIDLGPSIDLAWVDELTVAALGESGAEVLSDLWLVDIGGFTTDQKVVIGAADITARQGERTLVVVDSEGGVYSRSGTVWSRVAVGPTELAYAG